MKQNKELTFKESFVTNIETFFNTKKILLWVILLVITLSVIFLFFWNSNTKRIAEESTILIEGAQLKFTEWLNEEEDNIKSEYEDALLEELSTIIKKYPKSYATQRSLFIRAKYYIKKGEWENAAKDFKDLAASFPTSILAEESLLNAASCYEEISNYNEAIALHKEFQEKFAGSHKISYSYFSTGRIFEIIQNYKEAAQIYEKLETDYSTSSWTKLAQNRLIFLKANNFYKKE